MEFKRIKSQLLRTQTLRWLLIGGIVWFVVASLFWWQHVYTNPRVVFENMLRNNMMTEAYTRTTTQSGQGLFERKSQMQLGASPHIRTIETLSQGESRQVTEYITTQEESFARLLVYPDSAVTNIWAKLGENDTFDQEIIDYTFFPMGSVPQTQRAELLRFIEQNSVYTPDYSTVETEIIDGKTVLTYEVTVQLQAYAAMIKRLSEVLGFTELANATDPAAFAGTDPVKLTVSIDSRNHRLVQTRSGTDIVTSERFSGYGISKRTVTMPETYLSIEELQQRLE